MSKRRTMVCICALFLLPLCCTLTHPSAALAVGQAESRTLSDAEMETFLKTAKLTNRRTLNTGVTRSGRATLIDGDFRHDVHVQTIDEYKVKFDTPQGIEMNFKDTWKFNVAAYRLDKLLGLGMTPMSVQRMVGGSSASVTWWIDDAMTESDRLSKKIDPPDPVHWNHQMYVVRVFDQLIHNMDRNLQNLLITKDWKIWMIDHTRAFRLLHALRTPENLTHCDRKLMERLKALDRKTLDATLKPYITSPEISGVLARRDRIVKHFEQLIAKNGESEVMYDYLK